MGNDNRDESGMLLIFLEGGDLTLETQLFPLMGDYRNDGNAEQRRQLYKASLKSFQVQPTNDEFLAHVISNAEKENMT